MQAGLYKPCERIRGMSLNLSKHIFAWINFWEQPSLSFCMDVFLQMKNILSCFHSLNKKKMRVSREKSIFCLYKNFVGQLPLYEFGQFFENRKYFSINIFSS